MSIKILGKDVISQYDVLYGDGDNTMIFYDATILPGVFTNLMNGISGVQAVFNPWDNCYSYYDEASETDVTLELNLDYFVKTTT